jgi:hypothetical protein
MKVLEALLPEIDTTILDNHTPFSEAMERVDDAILNGDSFDLYLPLTLIALYSRSPIGADKWGCAFSDNAEVEIYLSRFFSKMAVPKKEKERISSTIRILKELLSDGLSGDFKGEKWSIKALEDVIAILRILPSSGHDRLLYKLLKDAIRGDRDGSKNIPIDISEQQGRRRRQRRRGGRKGHATKAVGNL